MKFRDLIKKISRNGSVVLGIAICGMLLASVTVSAKKDENLKETQKNFGAIRYENPSTGDVVYIDGNDLETLKEMAAQTEKQLAIYEKMLQSNEASSAPSLTKGQLQALSEGLAGLGLHDDGRLYRTGDYDFIKTPDDGNPIPTWSDVKPDEMLSFFNNIGSIPEDAAEGIEKLAEPAEMLSGSGAWVRSADGERLEWIEGTIPVNDQTDIQIIYNDDGSVSRLEIPAGYYGAMSLPVSEQIVDDEDAETNE